MGYGLNPFDKSSFSHIKKVDMKWVNSVACLDAKNQEQQKALRRLEGLDLIRQMLSEYYSGSMIVGPIDTGLVPRGCLFELAGPVSIASVKEVQYFVRSKSFREEHPEMLRLYLWWKQVKKEVAKLNAKLELPPVEVDFLDRDSPLCGRDHTTILDMGNDNQIKRIRIR